MQQQRRRAAERNAPSQQEEQSQQGQALGVKQNMDERRYLRKSYRELIQDTTVNKQELIQPESDGLLKALDKSDSLYKHVQQPREAALDSEFLTIATQFGAEQADRLNLGFKTHSVPEFISRVRVLLKNDEISSNDNVEEEEEDNGDIDHSKWVELGKKVMVFIKRTPTLDSILGPLNIEPPEKKARKKVVREKLAQRVNPEEIQDVNEGEEQNDKETAKRVALVRSYLDNSNDMDFFKFILNPESFGQTVENLFYFSFLIKDGQAGLNVNDTGVPVAQPTQPPTEEDYTTGKAERKQCVVKFDYDMWKQLKEGFEVNNAFLPKREPPRKKQTQASQSQGRPHTQPSDEDTTKKTHKKRSKQVESDIEEEEQEEEEELQSQRKRLRKSKSKQ